MENILSKMKVSEISRRVISKKAQSISTEIEKNIMAISPVTALHNGGYFIDLNSLRKIITGICGTMIKESGYNCITLVLTVNGVAVSYDDDTYTDYGEIIGIVEHCKFSKALWSYYGRTHAIEIRNAAAKILQSKEYEEYPYRKGDIVYEHCKSDSSYADGVYLIYNVRNEQLMPQLPDNRTISLYKVFPVSGSEASMLASNNDKTKDIFISNIDPTIGFVWEGIGPECCAKEHGSVVYNVTNGFRRTEFIKFRHVPENIVDELYTWIFKQ